VTVSNKYRNICKKFMAYCSYNINAATEDTIFKLLDPCTGDLETNEMKKKLNYKVTV